MPTPTSRAAGFAAAALAVPMLLAGCSSDSGSTAGSQADAVEISDQWIKAADSGMSAAFATFTNNGDREARIVDATSPAAGRMEIHETVDANGAKTMRPKAGGLVVPAHGSVALKAGSDHLMFLDLEGPLRTGAQTPVTVKFADGSVRAFTAQVRDFPGNKENYVPADSPAHGG
ncbi:copper chaperone PCu(A)C [Nocardia sp. CDC159]|uniref:Copper chaperone PCu(A)C n=1 Tax=Nocardia pulmonis TaxID=2951408 RepID=A0A9X2E9J9_9NOCA|nr:MULTISPECIES: copper chaperone PCu(A)C [Nocardia]MCM6775350.1 copper chaperone PCu(A)C [Nocardia pulmonis]MCM6787916.1 copper chaperone PCu(A)C [Nocardia sp. CDC159]